MLRAAKLTLALAAAAVAMPAQPRYLPKIAGHYDRLIEAGTDRYGPRATALWLASIDIHKGGQFEPPPAASRRTYRTIHAPHGSTPYWDQPAVAFSFWLSDRTGEPRYREAAEAYIRDFLRVAVEPESGYFLWGNHLFYDVFADELVDIFEPWHEMRPITPAWEMFSRIDPVAAKRAAAAAARGHLLDGETGLFNRHASTRSRNPGPADPMPFLAAGGTLIRTLAWLSAQPGSDSEVFLDKAKKVMRYSHGARNLRTGLMPVQPVVDRWDRHAATTETGLWASSLLDVYRMTGLREFRERAADALRGYLSFGFDTAEQRFYGMLRIEDGSPLRERTTEWQPGRFSDVWEPLFPSHDYPAPFAEACITLWEMTGQDRYHTCVRQWTSHIQRSLPPSYRLESITGDTQQLGAYAESYGRVIHFLVRASETFDEPAWKDLALEIAEDAVKNLWSEDAGMFRSHPGEDRTDSVDGLGYLFAALAYLETGDDPDLMGAGF